MADEHVSPVAPPSHRWRLRAGQAVSCREWDDEYIVFNDLTGDCHLLDASGFAVLAYLQQHRDGADPAMLALALASQFDDLVPADPATIAELEQVLAGLAGCDLIEVLA